MSTKLKLDFKPQAGLKSTDGPCWTNDGKGTSPIVVCECGKPVTLKNAVIKPDGSVTPDLDHGCKKGPFTVTLNEYGKH